MKAVDHISRYTPPQKPADRDEDIRSKGGTKHKLSDDYYFVAYGCVTKKETKVITDVAEKVPKGMLAKEGKVVIEITKRMLGPSKARYNGSTTIRSNYHSPRTYHRIEIFTPFIKKIDLAHEIGHAVIETPGNKQLLRDKGWPAGQQYDSKISFQYNPFDGARKSGFVTRYASVNEDEDMAESIAFYLDSPEKFLEMAKDDPVLTQKYAAVDRLFKHYQDQSR